MNKKFIKMNEQESLALIEALKTTKIAENVKNIKKIEANKSNTRQILNRQLPKFLSVAQKIESTSEIVKKKSNSNTSIYELKRSIRIMHADNLLELNNNEYE